MSFCGHIDTVRCANCTPRVYEQQVPVDQVTTTTRANPLVAVPERKEVGRLAIRVEGLLSRLRTDAVLRPRWYRPSWQAGREAGLAEAHEAVQIMLNERGLPHFGPRQ